MTATNSINFACCRNLLIACAFVLISGLVFSAAFFEPFDFSPLYAFTGVVMVTFVAIVASIYNSSSFLASLYYFIGFCFMLLFVYSFHLLPSTEILLNGLGSAIGFSVVGCTWAWETRTKV